MKFEGYRTILFSIMAIVAGALQMTLGVNVDADQQQRLVEVGIGLLSIFGGGGSIIFRVIAGLPTLKAAAEEIARLKAQLEAVQKAKAEPPIAARVAAPGS